MYLQKMTLDYADLDTVTGDSTQVRVTVQPASIESISTTLREMANFLRASGFPYVETLIAIDSEGQPHFAAA